MTNKISTLIEEKELMRELYGATLDFYSEKIIEDSLSKIDEYIKLINFCKCKKTRNEILNTAKI